MNPSPATFGYLRNGVDVLIKKESARIGRVAEKRRERGMPVPDELATHADGTNWLDLFVSSCKGDADRSTSSLRT